MNKKTGKRSIFRALFVPMILVMMLQAATFYMAAVYGGVESSLTQNAVDILSQRLNSRKNEIENDFNNHWSKLDDCVAELDKLYSEYQQQRGSQPFAADVQNQIDFLEQSSPALIDALRYSNTNGIFLIINDDLQPGGLVGTEQKYGLCIRDMDQDSNYTGREDLVIERSPSSIIDSLGCQLDSWWEARYSFGDMEDGDYFYRPLNAAWSAPKAEGKDLAYLSPVHQISGSDHKMVSYSIPLCSEDGYPYAVLGVELSVKYLESLLPNRELSTGDSGSYVLALCCNGKNSYEPVAGTGPLFSRCFSAEDRIITSPSETEGGSTVIGRDGTSLYVCPAELKVYNNNNPFSSRRLVLLAITESEALFAYVSRIKTVLMLVSALSMVAGLAALTLVSRRFAAPITALAKRVRGMDKTKSDYALEHLGITEIDQLVDSIEVLNRSVSRNSARTEFFSRMSHDMRTPMNAIISFSSPEMLEDADETAKSDYLAKINASGMYLLGLINEVLDMTKIENETTELRVAAQKMAGLFDTTISVIEKLAQKKGVRFTWELAIPSDLTVLADKQHLSQILINLLSNAVKFTPEGGRVSLAADVSGEGGQRSCCITVTDTGVGMSPEFMKKLYTPFAQENSSHEGTGLGLSIAKNLTELMGGSMDCQSEKNVGTTFILKLPFTVAVYAAAPEQEKESASRLRGKCVLVCEDNAINTIILVQLLERVGMSVEKAENGRIGVDMFMTAPAGTYDAVLMDIRMPEMNGLDATRAIRALPRTDAASIPIIAMTADAFAEDAKVSFAAGMNEHLSKPIEVQKLYSTLLKFICPSAED